MGVALASSTVLLLCWLAASSAHVTSTGIATLDVAGTALRYRLSVVATEVDYHGGRLLAEAAVGDSSAVRRATAFARDYARLSIDGEDCQPGAIAIRSAGNTDKIVIEMVLTCPKSVGVLTMRDDWPDLLGAHFQTLLSVRTPGRPSFDFIFFEARRTATLDLAQPAETGWAGSPSLP